MIKNPPFLYLVHASPTILSIHNKANSVNKQFIIFRPLYSPSLLLIPDLSGMNNQHTSTQTQSRNEVWRSETILQVFIDVWLSVEQFNGRNVEVHSKLVIYK